ncbi:MAG: hypothetical protein D6785_13650 [Planctomycetota bacterium]|nr:MAG: hypothetical protein D6785_13650 [Planctomycetota bacterium]
MQPRDLFLPLRKEAWEVEGWIFFFYPRLDQGVLQEIQQLWRSNWEKKAFWNLYRKGRRIYGLSTSYGKLAVKVYPRNEPRAYQAYYNACLLKEKGVPAPAPIGFGYNNQGESFWIGTWQEGMPWTRHFQRLGEYEKIENLKSLAAFIAHLHETGLFHRDLSHWNILASAQGFFLLDLEDIQPLFPFSAWKKSKNLCQILAPLWDLASPKERDLLIQEYKKLSSSSFSLPKAFLSFWSKRRNRRIHRFYESQNKAYSFLE